MKQLPSVTQKLSQLLAFLTYAIIALVPFYAFVTTWIGSNTGGLLFWRAWKELLLVLLVGLSFVLVIKTKQLRIRLFADRLVLAAALFATWVIGGVLIVGDDVDAALLGMVMQLRPFAFLLVAMVAAFYRKPSEEFLVKLVAVPAIGVVAFGLLQMFALPHDFLKHFGYQKNVTVPPYFTIDEQLDKLRIASTLRGPNPLGVYLIAPLLLLTSRLREMFVQNKNSDPITLPRYAARPYRMTWFAICYLLFALTVLYGSHSRSAWLGLLVAGLMYVWLNLARRWQVTLVGMVAVIGLLGSGFIYTQRHTGFVQDVILHDNPTEGGEISSNQGHLEALQGGVDDIAESPVWGCGAGCAGPASVHNQAGSKIAENFFLQTAQESGLVGLFLLIVIYVMVGLRLFVKKTWLAWAWLSVGIGVSVASLLSHAWADDTITYIWWGIAGLLLGVRGRSAKQHTGVGK